MKKVERCSTPSCPEDAKCAGLCSGCYSGRYYWNKKGVVAQQRRKTKLRIFSERLDDLGHVRNVTSIRRRRVA
jgi:hypothetical protein